MLLTSKSPVIYNYLSTYGESGFINTDFMKIAKNIVNGMKNLILTLEIVLKI